MNGRGRDQAEAAGRILARLIAARSLEPRGLDFVASPLDRARDTMERLRAVLGLDPASYRLDDRLKEIGFGHWEGRTWTEIAAVDSAAVKARKRDKWHTVPPGGESYAQLQHRVAAWLDTVAPHSVVVAHGGVARAILTLTTDLLPSAAPDTLIRQGRVLCIADGAAVWA